MDFFTKNKLLFWCVVILVIINITTLTAFWFGRPPIGPLQTTQGPGGQKIMEERLHLSPEQTTAVQSIRREHFQRSHPLQDQMHKIRLDILEEQFSEQPDEEQINQWCTDLGNLQTEFEENLTRHFQELKAVCDSNQTEELKRMLKDLIERTRPRPPEQHPLGRGSEGRPAPGRGPLPPSR